MSILGVVLVLLFQKDFHYNLDYYTTVCLSRYLLSVIHLSFYQNALNLNVSKQVYNFTLLNWHMVVFLMFLFFFWIRKINLIEKGLWHCQAEG